MDISELTKGWVRFGGQIIDISKICYIVKGNYEKHTAYLSSGSVIQLPSALVDLILPYAPVLNVAEQKTNAEGSKIGGGPYLDESRRPIGRVADDEHVRQVIEDQVHTAPGDFVYLTPACIVKRSSIVSVLFASDGIQLKMTDGHMYSIDPCYWEQIKEALL